LILRGQPKIYSSPPLNANGRAAGVPARMCFGQTWWNSPASSGDGFARLAMNVECITGFVARTLATSWKKSRPAEAPRLVMHERRLRGVEFAVRAAGQRHERRVGLQRNENGIDARFHHFLAAYRFVTFVLKEMPLQQR
jgi:hypothetical protein